MAPDSTATVRLARGSYAVDPTASEAVSLDLMVDQDVTVPLVQMPQTKDSAARMLGASLVLATSTPTTRGWPTVPQSFTVRDPWALQ